MGKHVRTWEKFILTCVRNHGMIMITLALRLVNIMQHVDSIYRVRYTEGFVGVIIPISIV